MPSTSPVPVSQRVPTHTVADFCRGVHDIWRGFGFLLARPRLWVWAGIPFVLNVASFLLLSWAGWHFMAPWLHGHFFADGGFWSSLLGWLLGALFWLVMALVIIFAFVPLATLLASPFNDILSEKVERLYAGQAEPGFSLRAMTRAIAVGLSSSLRLMLLTLVLLACVLPLHLIPVYGSLVATLASAAITIWFLSLQFTAYSMDRRFYSYAQRKDFLRENRARSVGLGTMAFLIMMVPVLNAFFIPVSAVAGTLLFCDTALWRGPAGR